MEQVCGVSPNNLRKNYQSLRVFLGTKCFLLTWCGKSLITDITTPKPDNFMQLFRIFVNLPV